MQDAAEPHQNCPHRLSFPPALPSSFQGRGFPSNASGRFPIDLSISPPSSFSGGTFPCALRADGLLSAGDISNPCNSDFSSDKRGLRPFFVAMRAFRPHARCSSIRLFYGGETMRDFLVFQHRPGILFPPLGRVIFFRPRGAAGGCAVPRPVSSSRPSCAAIWRGRAFWHSDGFPGSWRAVWLR